MKKQRGSAAWRLALLAGLMAIAGLAVLAWFGSPAAATISAALIGAGVLVLRDYLENVVGGLFILWTGQLRMGDTIRVSSPDEPGEELVLGEIRRITLLAVEVRDRDNVSMLLPNSQILKHRVSNWGANGPVRIRVYVTLPKGIGPQSKVRSWLQKSAGQVTRVLEDPGPSCIVSNVSQRGTTYLLRFWIEDPRCGIRNVLSAASERILDGARERELEVLEVEYR